MGFRIRDNNATDLSFGEQMKSNIFKRNLFHTAAGIVLGLTFCFGTASGQTTPQTHDEFVQAGKEAASKGDFKTAANWYSKAIEVQPDDYDIIFARAGCYGVLGEHDEAIKDLNTILKAKPDAIGVLRFRGQVYNGRNDWKKGFNDADALLKLDPNDADGYQIRGLAQAGMKKCAEAEADLAIAIRLSPNNHMNYTVRSAIYAEQGKAAQAQADKLTAERLKAPR